MSFNSHPHIEYQRRERAVCHRMMIVATLLVLGFTGISLRLWWLQVKEAPRLALEAAKLRLVKDDLPAMRGSIMDRTGRLLAQDRMVHEFYADEAHLRDIRFVRPRLARLLKRTVSDLRSNMTEADTLQAYNAHVANALAPLVNMPEADLLRVLEPKGLVAPVLIKGLLTDEADVFQAKLEELKIGGVYRRSVSERFRPLGEERFSHVLGLVTREQLKENKVIPRRGIEGVEQLMESTLRGIDGFEFVERDASRKHELPGFAGEIQPPVNGSHVHLTIDTQIQQGLENALKHGYDHLSANKILAVIVEPSTGSILAMASEPREQRNKDGDMERRNMTVTDVLEPGSVIKLITLAAGLDTQKVSADTTFYCHQGFYQESKDVWVRDDEAHDTLSVRDILVHSSNIGAYKIAKRLGSETFHSYLTRFGLGQRTGLGFPREASGLLRAPAKWTAPSLSRLAMGYEVSVTPLQMAMVVSAIANGGKLMQPRIVDRITSSDRSTTRTLQPIEVGQACSASVARTMTDALEGVVLHGTGKKAAIEGIRVAGKTGTAQRFNPETKHYQKGHFVCSFVGFAPADKPEIACVVMIDDPKSDNKSDLYGGKLAAPLWAEIVQSTLATMHQSPIAALSPTVPTTGGEQ